MNTALFIDINTTDLKNLDFVCKDAADGRHVIMKQAYGYIGRNEKKRNLLEKEGFLIIDTQSEYKSRTPLEMILDMAETAENDHIDEIYLVTGESYCQPIVRNLLKKGKKVTIAAPAAISQSYISIATRFRFIEILAGMSCGDAATPISDVVDSITDLLFSAESRGEAVTSVTLYQALCTRYHEFDVRNYGFTSLEALIHAHVSGVTAEKGQIKLVDNKERVESFIYSYLGQRDNKIEDMDELEAALKAEFPDFDTKNYGYRLFMAFLLSFPKLEIYNNKGVKLKQSFKLK